MKTAIELAKEAGCDLAYGLRNPPVITAIGFTSVQFERLVELVREACAEVADRMDPLQDGAIGAAIRARSNT